MLRTILSLASLAVLALPATAGEIRQTVTLTNAFDTAYVQPAPANVISVRIENRVASYRALGKVENLHPTIPVPDAGYQGTILMKLRHACTSYPITDLHMGQSAPPPPPIDVWDGVNDGAGLSGRTFVIGQTHTSAGPHGAGPLPSTWMVQDGPGGTHTLRVLHEYQSNALGTWPSHYWHQHSHRWSMVFDVVYVTP